MNKRSTKHFYFFSLLLQTLALIVFLTVHVPAQASNAPKGEAKTPSHDELPPASEDGQASAVIPFATNARFRSLIVSVSINGQEPLPFIVDTGLAQPVIITKWAADKLKLTPSNGHISLFPQDQDYPSADLQSLVLKGEKMSADIECDLLAACIGSDAFLSNFGTPRVAGILGMPFFSQLVMQIDFSQHVISLSRHQDRLLPDKDALRLTLIQPNVGIERYFVVWPTPSLKGAGSTRLVLDTGASTSGFPEAIISSSQPYAMSTVQTVMNGAKFQSGAWFLPHFRAGNDIVSNLVVTQSLANSEVLRVSTLGMDILHHFRVTLDFPGKQMFLDKFDNQPSTSAPTTTGIMLKKRDAGFFVQGILLRSPAEKSSIHVGDRITEVDGTPMIADDDETAQQLLDGNANTDANLMVLSAEGKLRQVTLPRLNLYDASLYPDYGFLIVKRSPGQAYSLSQKS